MENGNKPGFSVFYFDKNGLEATPETPIEAVSEVSLKIDVQALVDNTGLGTAILKGFMQERTDEFVRVVRVIRERNAQNQQASSRIIQPGVGGVVLPPGVKIVN